MRRARLERAAHSPAFCAAARLRPGAEDGATVGEYMALLVTLFAAAGIVWKLVELTSEA